jgi:hypothetical protein
MPERDAMAVSRGLVSDSFGRPPVADRIVEPCSQPSDRARSTYTFRGLVDIGERVALGLGL